MRMNFNLQTPNLNLSKIMSEEAAKDVLFQAMVKMECIAKDKAPVNTGNLKNRINLQPPRRGSKLYVLNDGVNYGVYVEYGTKPHYVPIAPLKDWAKKVLGDENAAYAIRAKIAKLGTASQPFFRPAFDEVRTLWLPIIKARVLKQYYG